MTVDDRDDYPDVLPDDTRKDLALDAAAIFASLLPGLGGAISNVISGWSAERKRERVREVIDGLALRLANLHSKVAEEYVRSDELEDLLDQTLRRVANERHESKRRLYREFLVGAVTTPAPYDEQLRVLRALDELQAAHLGLLRALMQEPDAKHADAMMSSPAATLTRRVPGLSREQLGDLVAQLETLRIVTSLVTRLHTGMTGGGAEDLRNSITPFGNRFVEYILRSGDEGA